LLCLVIGICDKVDALFMFHAKTVPDALLKNGSSLASRVSGDRKECIEWNILRVWERHERVS